MARNRSFPLRQWVVGAAARLGDLILPRMCDVCGVPIGPSPVRFCELCAIELSRTIGGPYCATCGLDRSPHLLLDGRCTGCRLGRMWPRFDRFIRVGPYRGPLRELILRFKREFVLDRLLGDLLADAVEGRLDPREVDYWVPVPSHWRRRLVLGYQPTALLAGACVRRWRGEVAPLLRAVRFVPPFHYHPGLSLAAKLGAIRGAFRAVRAPAARGRTVCLVDDVSTTGATLAEARRALRAAGVRRILVAVVARASPAAAPSSHVESTHPGR